VDVNWSASGDGGSPITGYRATASPGGQSCISINVTGCRITGLSNGVGYTVSVVAANAFGSSQAATTSSFWPVPGVAYAVYPTDAIVKAGSPTSAVVSGAPPATTVSVTLAKGKASCLTTPAGQCLATFASSSPSLAAATAKCKSGKATLSASSATKVAVPKAKLPTSIKRLKTLTLSVSSALPGSTVRLSLFIGTTNVSAQAVADSAGVSILTMVVPNKAGTATLTLTDGGVAVASGSLAIT